MSKIDQLWSERSQNPLAPSHAACCYVHITMTPAKPQEEARCFSGWSEGHPSANSQDSVMAISNIFSCITQQVQVIFLVFCYLYIHLSLWELHLHCVLPLAPTENMSSCYTLFFGCSFRIFSCVVFWWNWSPHNEKYQKFPPGIGQNAYGLEPQFRQASLADWCPISDAVAMYFLVLCLIVKVLCVWGRFSYAGLN